MNRRVGNHILNEHGRATVGDLRRALAGLPDSAPLFLSGTDGGGYDSTWLRGFCVGKAGMLGFPLAAMHPNAVVIEGVGPDDDYARRWDFELLLEPFFLMGEGSVPRGEAGSHRGAHKQRMAKLLDLPLSIPGGMFED